MAAANKLKMILLTLIAVTATHASADTYLCTLNILNYAGKPVLSKTKEVQVPAATEAEPYGIEAFGDIKEDLREVTYSPLYFMTKTAVENGVPKIEIGIYLFNKLHPTQKKLHIGAAGDARAFAELTAPLAGGSQQIKFGCRNKNYF